MSDQSFVKKQLELIESKEPLEVLSKTAKVLEGIVKQHDATTLQIRPFSGKWTPNEILGHLVDTEWIFGFRMRHMYSEHEPLLVDIDQEAWVSRQGHNLREPASFVGQFGPLREQNLALWRRMTKEDLARTGRHSERDQLESLDFYLKLQAGHDLSHIDQITRYLAAIKELGSGI